MAQVKFFVPESQHVIMRAMLGSWQAEVDNPPTEVVENGVLSASEPVKRVWVYDVDMDLSSAMAVPLSLRIEGVTGGVP